MKPKLSEYYSPGRFKAEAQQFLNLIEPCNSLEQARERLFNRVTMHQFDTYADESPIPFGFVTRVRDCARSLRSILKQRSDKLTGFSVVQAFFDIAKGKRRRDLTPGFFAEMIHLINGLEARSLKSRLGDFSVEADLTGREAALVRSDELDKLWSKVQALSSRYDHGLKESARSRRDKNRNRILDGIGGDRKDWENWRWHVENVIKDPDQLGKLIKLKERALAPIRKAVANRIPFGITPFYLSLLDYRFESRDRALRAQVLPPQDYVELMAEHYEDRRCYFDFMQEGDTSPVDHITRRYPSIVILKPIRTCPQICVYCQRNWEIETACEPGAVTPPDELETAIEWIEQHPAVCEVLITGGDPLLLDDQQIQSLLDRLAKIPHVDLVRIGSRMLVTLPQRITPGLAEVLGRFRKPGVRDLCLMTHLEHPYEITEDLVLAAERLRRQGISIYNQLVYSFYVSRRFEAATLRLLLRRIGIDPYYTFIIKGKHETGSYRVPIARVLQEQKEEARLLPGLRRTDEAVYNVPGQGKNYLRATQHRELLSIKPSGARVYEFHPWEKNMVSRQTFVGEDVPILAYLERLAELGEDPEDYESIWYYY